MTRRVLFFLAILATYVSANEPIKLNPGEVLIAINGVPVNQQCAGGTCAAQPVRNAVRAVAGVIVNRDARAYAFAQREANIQASRNRVGHFLGVAPGCTFAGVGSSYNANRPNHCTTRRGTLVARARACVGNKCFWSAHYK